MSWCRHCHFIFHKQPTIRFTKVLVGCLKLKSVIILARQLLYVLWVLWCCVELSRRHFQSLNIQLACIIHAHKWCAHWGMESWHGIVKFLPLVVGQTDNDSSTITWYLNTVGMWSVSLQISEPFDMTHSPHQILVILVCFFSSNFLLLEFFHTCRKV